MKLLTPEKRALLEQSLRGRFSDADERWTEVQESPHYPLIMENMRTGTYDMVGLLLQEIWEGIDR